MPLLTDKHHIFSSLYGLLTPIPEPQLCLGTSNADSGTSTTHLPTHPIPPATLPKSSPLPSTQIPPLLHHHPHKPQPSLHKRDQSTSGVKPDGAVVKRLRAVQPQHPGVGGHGQVVQLRVRDAVRRDAADEARVDVLDGVGVRQQRGQRRPAGAVEDLDRRGGRDGVADYAVDQGGD